MIDGVKVSILKVCMISSPVSGKLKDGIGSHVFELSKHISRLGCEVHVFCFNEITKDLVVDGIFVHSIGVSKHGSRLSLYPELLLGMTRELNHFAKKYNLDVVHGHGGYAVGAIMSRLSRRIGKFVVTIHGVAYDEFRGRIRGIREFEEELSKTAPSQRALIAGFYMPFSKVLGTVVYNLTDMDIATCDFVAKEASEVYHIPFSRIKMIPHSVDPSRFSLAGDTHFRELLGLNGRKVVLYVGQLIARKGLITLLNAFSMVHKKIPDATLLYIGKGYMKESLQLQARKLNMQGSVIIYDQFITEEEFPRIYSVGDVFVTPSLYESGISTCLLQAMSSCKPVIATNIGAFPEIISNNFNGFLVEKANAIQLADSISFLLSNEKCSKEMGERGRETVVAKFNWKTNAGKIVKLYESLI